MSAAARPMERPARTVLGISALYHDSAAALVHDGAIVAAAQEERFTRVRHDAAFPRRAIQYCLAEAGLREGEIDLVCFYEKPILKFERILSTYLAYAPLGFASFREALPQWLQRKLHIPREMRRHLPGYLGPFAFTSHHESHAASAFFPSPFEEAAILTCDGVGEWATTTVGVGRGRSLRLLQSISFPHSLGLLYSAFTYFAGFKVNSGEYKLMGLAPYGRPVYAELIKEKLVDIRPDGSFRLNMDYFTYPYGLRMTGAKFARLFGGPPRAPESTITQREMDLAASIQVVTEEILLAMARHAHEVTGSANLCLAGGVALNCVANGRVLREGPFKRLWIQPAAGDAGGALGAALFVWHQLLERDRAPTVGDAQMGSLLGPAYGRDAIATAVREASLEATLVEDEARLLERIVELIAAEKVVGWFHGRMEFGPRALGARSIIGDARSARMQATMNLKIKYRESFRPFAPCVLRERAAEFFGLEGSESPYMLLVAGVREEHRLALSESERRAQLDPDLRQRVNVVRSTVPAVTHVDYSARIQTVDEARHGRFYRLMKAFERTTGCPVLVNTSFNVRGEPIVNTPLDAIECFRHTDMDALVLGDFLALKERQPSRPSPVQRKKHLLQFQAD